MRSYFILALAALMQAGLVAAVPSGNFECPGPPSVLRSLDANVVLRCPNQPCSATVPCCQCYLCNAGLCIL
ncbi:hypothetical protein DFH09DRAFT_1170029 [Mycena vulgaris]|nr:hypothetical protein DFH09DRAFT_1170029 [Mycena vulgaris]